MRHIKRCYFTAKAWQDARQARHKAHGSGFEFDKPMTSAERPAAKLCDLCMHILQRNVVLKDCWVCSICRRKIGTGKSLLECRACNVTYCTDCKLTTPEMPTEQPTTSEMPTEQPTTPEMPIEAVHG